MHSKPLQVALRFVQAINAHDLAAIVALMAEEHRFIDSLGEVYVGRERMRDAWEQYFRMVRDYRIEIEESLADGPVVVLLGRADGTYSRGGALRTADRWSTPAAWRVRVADGRVVEWQVYADNEPIRQRMRLGSA